MTGRLCAADFCRMAERLERTGEHLYRELAAGSPEHRVGEVLAACAREQAEQADALRGVCCDHERPRWWRRRRLPGDQDLYLASLASEHAARALGLDGAPGCGQDTGSVWECAFEAAVRLETELLGLYEDNTVLFARAHAELLGGLVGTKRRHLATLMRIANDRERTVSRRPERRDGAGRTGSRDCDGEASRAVS